MADYYDEDEREAMGEVGSLAHGMLPAGTANRPLNPGERAAWERQGMARRPTFDPTVRWGDKKLIALEAAATAFITTDILNVNLARPTTCRIQFHAEVLKPLTTEIIQTNIDLFIGNGAQQTHVKRSFSYMPQTGNNRSIVIDATWEIPLTNIRGRVAIFGSAPGGGVVECSLWLCPLVNHEAPIPVKEA